MFLLYLVASVVVCVCFVCYYNLCFVCIPFPVYYCYYCLNIICMHARTLTIIDINMISSMVGSNPGEDSCSISTVKVEQLQPAMELSTIL